jgi:geranylgeranyl transferase type-1 subunit beta
MAIVFYCLGTLDLLDVLQNETTDVDRISWRKWIWEQYAGESLPSSVSITTHVPGAGRYGTGFRPGPFMTRTSVSESTLQICRN